MGRRPYYQDALVTLYHGDCREISEWLKADVLVTDPPYGISMSTVADRNRPAIAGEPWIGQSSSRVIPRSHCATRDSALELWGSRPALVFGHWRAPRPVDTRMRLIWDRVIVGLGGVRPFRPTDEEIYLVGNWPNSRVGPRGRAVSSVLRHRALRGSARPPHPTPKPVPLMVELLGYCPPGVVADPFAGSGATLIAARQLGRTAIGVELEEKYCELIATRLSAGLPVLPAGVPGGVGDVLAARGDGASVPILQPLGRGQGIVDAVDAVGVRDALNHGTECDTMCQCVSTPEDEEAG